MPDSQGELIPTFTAILQELTILGPSYLLSLQMPEGRKTVATGLTQEDGAMLFSDAHGVLRSSLAREPPAELHQGVELYRNQVVHWITVRR